MKTTAKQILNGQEGPLVSIIKTHPFLTQNISVLSVIFHSVTVLLCRQKVDMLLPFETMLHHPASLVVSALFSLSIIVVTYLFHPHRTVTYLQCQMAYHRKTFLLLLSQDSYMVLYIMRMCVSHNWSMHNYNSLSYRMHKWTPNLC